MKPILSQREHAREALYLKLMIKSLLIALLALCVSFKAKADNDSCDVKLFIHDTELSEAIPFANVVVYQNGEQIKTGVTDFDGRCIIKKLAQGKYDFKAVYVGYQAKMIKNVEVKAEKTNSLSINLEGHGIVLTCCCSCYCGYYDGPTENWWPKLWTPYREAYKAWKEKKEKKQALAAKQPKKNEIKLSEEPDEVETIDSNSVSKVEIPDRIVEQIHIYPNPATDILHIQSTKPLQTITLRNAEGKIVKEEVIENDIANINLSDFSSGVYYLNYVLNGKSEVKRVMVVER